MPFEIRYSPRANSEYEEIIDYVFQKFGKIVALKVYLHFEEIINQISINPLLFPYSNKVKNLRRCVISPQTNNIILSI
jgi:plasmid stabilization system protein ParE